MQISGWILKNWIICTKGNCSWVLIDTLKSIPLMGTPSTSRLIFVRCIRVDQHSADYRPTADQMPTKCQPNIDQDVDQVLIEMSIEGINWGKWSTFDCWYLKVTVYLQGCLTRKQCSVYSLNCRYLNPYIKLKLMELAIKLYQEFWKKMNCRIFHGHQMRAPESPFESYKSKRISFFANLIFSSVSGLKGL